MTNKKIFLLMVCSSLLSLSACYKDLGNYTYHDINELQFKGIDSSYTVLLGDTLRINPELIFSMDPSNDTGKYTYEWTAIRIGNVLPADRLRELPKYRNLNTPINLAPDRYEIHYRVKEKESKRQWDKTFLLDVKTSIYEGYLLLSDVDGKSRLDMLSLQKSKATNKDTFYLMPDVLALTGSTLPPQGKPYQVFSYQYDPKFWGIYILTESGTNKIHPETFKYDLTYNIRYEMVGKVTDGFKGDYMEGLSNTAWMISEGNSYYYQRVSNTRMNLRTNTVPNPDTAIYLNLAPLLVQNGSDAIFYDKDSRRFVKQLRSKLTMSEMPIPSTKLFDYKTGKDLMYIESTRLSFGSNPNSGSIFAVLKDPAGSKCYLARFEFAGNQTYYDEITGTDIDKAEKFAVSPDLGYLFYSVGGKLYEYDLSLKTSKLMLDKGSQIISTLKFQYFLYRWAPSKVNTYKVWSDKLMVCAYDPAGAANNGTMTLYTVPPVNGDLIPYQSCSGLGKVVSVTYRERL